MRPAVAPGIGQRLPRGPFIFMVTAGVLLRTHGALSFEAVFSIPERKIGRAGLLR